MKRERKREGGESGQRVLVMGKRRDGWVGESEVAPAGEAVGSTHGRFFPPFLQSDCPPPSTVVFSIHFCLLPLEKKIPKNVPKIPPCKGEGVWMGASPSTPTKKSAVL